MEREEPVIVKHYQDKIIIKERVVKIPVKKIVEKERVVEKIEKVPKIKLVPKIVYSVQEVPKVEISYVNVEVSLWIEVAALESLRR